MSETIAPRRKFTHPHKTRPTLVSMEHGRRWIADFNHVECKFGH